MATVYEIIQGINQAAANGAWDGAHSADLAADGKARTAGLKREEGHFINDRRVMDGFQVKFMGPLMRLTYQSEILIKDVKKNDFEDTIVSQLKDIIKFLKKEYKAITGETLTLTLEGEHHIFVQRMSNYRTDVIGGLQSVADLQKDEKKRNLDTAVRDWLSLGPKGRPKNDTRKGK
jgi:hypothetical protein